MTMNPLPPQAYTKDTLLKAYHWLQGQPPQIRELATSPDLLVSLYLKASRDGDSALDRPSIQNFKSELRNLAGMMGELERPKPAEPTRREPMDGGSRLPPAQTAAPSAAQTSSPPVSESALNLDSKSLEMLREIKEQFNLSEEREALRMLIKIGYTKAKNWLDDR